MLANRPEREVVGSGDLQNGLHHNHMGMMPDPLLNRHGLSAAASGSERACYLGSFAVRSGQAVPTQRMAVCAVIPKSRISLRGSPVPTPR
ncbi:hypothetical protein OH781_03895 [Streptomyces sp. NBC_01550]|uniref:hypothetical protein n=1 Tax=Streptomyces sp. NBC_01550 TaxID=2975875 RepID=UPI00386E935A